MSRIITRALVLAAGAGVLAASLPAQVRTARPIGTIGPTTSGGATLVAPAPVGPAPSGLQVSGTPALAVVSWQPAPNAVSYAVTRWLKSNPSCCRNTISGLTSTSWTDNNGQLQSPGVYVFSLSATYADGSVGTAQYEWTRPDPFNPANLAVRQVGPGEIELSWTTVGSAAYYLVWGHGLADATRVPGNTYSVRVTGVSSGTHQYTVAAYWEPGPVSTDASAFTRVSARVSGSASNEYRVSINGFIAHQQTAEDLLRQDGGGDEVFARAWFHRFNRQSGALLAQGGPQSEVHGDTYGWPYRIRAGKATGNGGIQHGDTVPQGSDPSRRPAGTPSARTFPFLMFEGPLSDYSDLVIVRPSLWEYDGDPAARQWWSQAVAPPDARSVFKEYQRVTSQAGLRLWHFGRQLLSAQASAGFALPGQVLPGMDRPIGMNAPADCSTCSPTLIDHALVLTREQIEEALAGQPWVILPYRLTDSNPGGNLKYDGDYTLFILVERVR
jgi:hypothetical protein